MGNRIIRLKYHWLHIFFSLSVGGTSNCVDWLQNGYLISSGPKCLISVNLLNPPDISRDPVERAGCGDNLLVLLAGQLEKAAAFVSTTKVAQNPAKMRTFD